MRRAEILHIAAELGASNVRVFGSVSRGDADVDSDVDFLVDIPRDVDGFAYFELRDELSQALGALLGRQVDVVSLRGPFSPRGETIARQIQIEATVL